MVSDQDKTVPEIRLTESQVGQVLEKAATIDASDSSGGLTISELHDIADQVGIPRAALSRALSEVALAAAAQDTRSRGWLHHRSVSFVRGRITDDDLAWLVRLLDELGQIHGRIRYERGALRWRSPTGFRVELVNRPGETHVSVEAHDHFATARAGVYAVSLGLLAGLVGADTIDAIYPLILGGAAGTAGFGAYLRVRAEKLRNSVGKASRGIAEVLQMVVKRRTEDH